MDVVSNVRRWTVPKESELRLESNTDTAPLFVTLLGKSGATAEIFGSEMGPNRKYAVYRGRCAVFTWTGCEVEVEGDCHAYVAEETPMLAYLNVHTTLESRRAKARAAKGYGPKVVIVGAGDVGKSTLARILCSYGARMGSAPVYVDLDVGQNAISVPGMLAACHVNKPVDIEHGMTQNSPLVYFYGHTSPGANLALYKKQMDVLAAQVSKHLASRVEARAGGLIVNTCGWVEKEGYDLVVYAIKAFKADVVLVIDNERVYADLRNKDFLATPSIEFVKLKKSGGVVARDQRRRALDRQLAIREYFRGVRGELHPHQVVIGNTVLRVCRVGGGPQAPSTALPLDAERAVDVTLPVLVQPAGDMVHTLGAVSYAQELDDALVSNVCGFVQVEGVEANRTTLLSPCPGKLPSTLVLLTDISCIDQ